MVRHGPICLEGPVTRRRRCWYEPHTPIAEAEAAPATFRADLVARIRQEIAEGDYDTPEKWEAALAHLLDRLEDR